MSSRGSISNCSHFYLPCLIFAFCWSYVVRSCVRWNLVRWSRGHRQFTHVAPPYTPHAPHFIHVLHVPGESYIVAALTWFRAPVSDHHHPPQIPYTPHTPNPLMPPRTAELFNVLGTRRVNELGLFGLLASWTLITMGCLGCRLPN